MISVLLVDPTPANPCGIRQLLASNGNIFRLHCANSYREIFNGFRSKSYDVCLIDAEMSSGLKLSDQARSLGWTAPIVLIASNDAGEAIRAIRSGVADCLIRDQLSVAGIEDSLCCMVEQARNISLMRERERRYMALLDNANQIVYTHDLDGRFLSINRAGELLLGYSQAEIRAMNIWQLLAPEYRVLMNNMIARTLDAQTQTRNEVKLLTKYGGALLVRLATHPINHDGQTIEIQGIASTHAARPRDVPSEFRHLTEQNYSRLILEPNRVSLLTPHEVSNSFPSLEGLSPSGRSILTL